MGRVRYIELTWTSDEGDIESAPLVESERCPKCCSTSGVVLDSEGWAKPGTHAPVQCHACEFAYAIPVQIVSYESATRWRVRLFGRERSWLARLTGSLRGLVASVRGVV